MTCQNWRFKLEYYSRAMWGVSDALLSAIRLAEQNAVLGLRCGRLRVLRDVDLKVLCNEPP